MANKKWGGAQGIFKKYSDDVIKKSKLFDFSRAVKDELNENHVAFSSNCSNCPESDSPSPIRFYGSEVQYWNGSAWVNTIADSVEATQLTSKTTAVVTNAAKGVITTVSLIDGINASFVFTLTNSKITSTSVIQLTALNTGTGLPQLTLDSAPIAGSVTIRVTNIGTAVFNSPIKIHYLIS